MTGACRGQGQRPRRGRAALAVLLSGLLLASAGFTALGVWQVHRLHWKLDLIARVDARIHAAPVAAPPPAQWPAVTAARDEYRHVLLHGRFLAGRDTRVKAVTDLGAGFWLLSPFRTDDGATVLVNRGFVPPDQSGVATSGVAAPARTEVTGLLRLSEPGGAFLHHNDPAAGRWYSRDTAAIAAARGLGTAAPFFIDEDAPSSAPTGGTLGTDTSAWPRAGLTVVHFRNSHLSYALTWFALALMSAGAAGYVAGEAWNRRRAPRPSDARDKPHP